MAISTQTISKLRKNHRDKQPTSGTVQIEPVNLPQVSGCLALWDDRDRRRGACKMGIVSRPAVLGFTANLLINPRGTGVSPLSTLYATIFASPLWQKSQVFRCFLAKPLHRNQIRPRVPEIPTNPSRHQHDRDAARVLLGITREWRIRAMVRAVAKRGIGQGCSETEFHKGGCDRVTSASGMKTDTVPQRRGFREREVHARRTSGENSRGDKTTVEQSKRIDRLRLRLREMGSH